ncbi:MAG TPA: FkbM family methyltransferase [Terriglobales bacterium]|nr:FkbM family methyltransferase [Terriglobales bacterium]
MTYPLSPQVNITVPINRIENAWELPDILAYEQDLIRTCCSALASLTNVTLFDCGADIGLFTALLCARCDRIARVVAFEPNNRVEQVLRHNLCQFPRSEVHMAAVSNFFGRGKLLAPAYDLGDHARFLAPAEQGFPVVTLDSLGRFGGDVLLKLDVEGEERNALEGARETIRRARHCVLTLEAHPLVSRRTGIDPKACLDYLASLRRFRFTVAETGRQVGPDDVILDPARVLNVVAVSE